MQHPPYWLTRKSIDKLVREELEAFKGVHAELITAFEKEERSFRRNDIFNTKVMHKGWKIGNFWYFSALDCLNGLYSLYVSHIQRIFAPTEDSGPDFDRIVSAYWSSASAEFIATKLNDKEAYSNRLCERFAPECDKMEKDDDRGDAANE